MLSVLMRSGGRSRALDWPSLLAAFSELVRRWPRALAHSDFWRAVARLLMDSGQGVECGVNAISGRARRAALRHSSDHCSMDEEVELLPRRQDVLRDSMKRDCRVEYR